MGEEAPFSAAEHAHDGKVHILLASSGSVATIKLPNIAEALGKYPNVSIRIIITQSAHRFLIGQSDEQPSLESLRLVKGVDGIYHDEDEWKKPWLRGDKILHIELRRWADVLLVAPLSANTLAKMSMGLADNLLLSVIRAWDTTGLIDPEKGRRTVFVAPAMNTAMWYQPVTKKQIKSLEEDWGADDSGGQSCLTVLRPKEAELACGDIGDGAMKNWTEIVAVLERYLKLDQGRV